MKKLNLDNVKEIAKEYWNEPEDVANLQLIVFTMCGGRYLGKFAAEQPGKFYIDSRVGKLPYGKREIYQVVEVLKIVAETNEYDPNQLPRMPRFHSCGIF